MKKIKILSFSWNLVPGLIRICIIQWWCSVFNQEYTFLVKFGSENLNCQFKLKFGISINSNMGNSMVMVTFSILDRKYPFRTNFVQKIKIVSLNWNLLLRIIRIWRIQWWCWFFCFLPEVSFFWEIGSEYSKLFVAAEI